MQFCALRSSLPTTVSEVSVAALVIPKSLVLSLDILVYVVRG